MSPHTKPSSKWIKDLKCVTSNSEAAGGKAGCTLQDRYTCRLSNSAPVAWEIRSVTDRWSLVRLQSVCTTDEMSIE